MRYTKNLTKNQKSVLDYISGFINEHGYSPLIEEIKNSMGFKSTRSVSQYLEGLVKKGYICKTRKPRSIEMVTYYQDMENNTVLVPMYGLASCGTPQFYADNNIEQHIPVDTKLLKGDRKNYYLVRASGTSMIDAGLDDLSLALVEIKDYYNENENVVVVINEKATIKRLHRGESAMVFMPVTSIKGHKPIIVNNDYYIAGKVVCTIPDPEKLDPEEIRIEPIIDELNFKDY